MPNHITNRLQFFGDKESIKQLVEKFSTFYPSVPDKSFDGELIYEKDNEYGWLNETSNLFTRRDKETHVGVPDGWVQKFTEEWTRFPDFAKVVPPPNTDAYNDKPSQNAVNHLPDWWHTWNTTNWGTKWNCYSCEKLSESEYIFETAWSCVKIIIQKIAEEFPDIKINYAFSDEDSGYNCGRFIFENGLIYSHIPEGGTKESYEIYFELHPDSVNNYKLVNGKYEYIEEE